MYVPYEKPKRFVILISFGALIAQFHNRLSRSAKGTHDFGEESQSLKGNIYSVVLFLGSGSRRDYFWDACCCHVV